MLLNGNAQGHEDFKTLSDIKSLIFQDQIKSDSLKLSLTCNILRECLDSRNALKVWTWRTKFQDECVYGSLNCWERCFVSQGSKWPFIQKVYLISTNKSSAIWHNTNSFLVINHVHYSMLWLMAFHVIWTFAFSNLPCLAVIVDDRIKQ